MKAANLNQLHANLIIEELVRCGITFFCISPGSRNTPLVIAAAENNAAETITHFDERGAAFCALGYARGCGRPAAVICTSGTAVANYLPAVVEGHESGTPLILLTADRPLEALNCDSYQTTDQRGMFGNFTRYASDLSLGEPTTRPEFLLSCVDRAVAKAADANAGPVHLNCRFREPLAPTSAPRDFSEELEELRDWTSSTEPYSKVEKLTPGESGALADSLIGRITAARRGVLIAGVIEDPDVGAAIVQLAQRWRWPLISDICSQTRFCVGGSDEVISFADGYLRFEEIAEALHADLVIQFGRTPISKFVAGYAAQASAGYIVVAPGNRTIDPFHRVTERISDRYHDVLRSLLKLEITPSELLPVMQSLEKASANAIEEWFAASDQLLLSSRVAVESCGPTIDSNPRSLYLATSMAIREANSFAGGGSHPIRVTANRGVNGIDGTIASAVGYAIATKQHTTLLIGDLATLHDLNSLALVSATEVPLTIVILNNDGGEIFSYLPVARVEAHFEEFFRTPHHFDFAHAADMFGIKYYQPLNQRDFATIYRHSIKGERPVIIEIKLDRDRSVVQHREYWKRLRDAAQRIIAAN